MLGARPIRIKNGVRLYCVSPTCDIGNYRFCTRVLNNNSAPVGASIARPLLPQGQFGLRTVIVVFASARPVTMAIIYFAPACCLTLCISEGEEPTSSAGFAGTFPSRGRQGQKHFSLQSVFTANSISDLRSALSACAQSLPLEGKVSAELTDEV